MLRALPAKRIRDSLSRDSLRGLSAFAVKLSLSSPQRREGTKMSLARVELRNILGCASLEIGEGEFFSFVGPSRCGKTRLLRMLAGLLPAAPGEILISGKRVTGPQTETGFIFSNPALLEWRTALSNVLLQAEVRGLRRTAHEARARRLLAAFGLSGSEERRPCELTPYLKVCVSICRALVHEPPLLILDDAFRFVDPIARERILMDLQHLWMSAGTTAVLVTENIREAVQLSDRVAVLSPHPAEVVQVFPIPLPRPRRMDKGTTPQIAEYSSRIRTLFHAQGVLP